MGLNNIAHCTFLVARKEGLSYEEFESEYLKHIPNSVPILKKYGATYYNVQFNSPASKAASIAALGLDEETGKTIVHEHYAIASIKFPNLAALKCFMESPKNREQLTPDGPRYTSELKQRVSIGTEWLGIEGGESVL